MHDDRTLLTEAFLGLVHLSNEINESFAHFRHALFGPFRVVEMPNRSRLTILDATKVNDHHRGPRSSYPRIGEL